MIGLKSRSISVFCCLNDGSLSVIGGIRAKHMISNSDRCIINKWADSKLANIKDLLLNFFDPAV